MARYLKRGMDAGAIKAADAEGPRRPSRRSSANRARRDVAVRELSQRFDDLVAAELPA